MNKASLQQNLLQKFTSPLLPKHLDKFKSVKYSSKLETQMEDPKLKVLHELEGECRITQLKFIRFHWLKAIFFLIPVAISIIGLWFLKNFKHFRVMIMYVSEDNPEDATHVWVIGNEGEYEQIQVLQKKGKKFSFMFKKLRYEVNGSKAFPLALRYWQMYSTYFDNEHVKKGQDTEKIKCLREEFGQNSHTVDIPSYFSYMFDIMTKPFFIVQYIICIMFVLQKIMVFAVLLLGSTLLTTSINYILLYVSYRKIKEIAEFKFPVKVMRNGRQETIESSELCPGDVLVISKQMNMPCDCLLMTGEAYVNEASLTGQSVPVGKYKVQKFDNLNEHSRWLLEGSIIMDCRGQSKALVIHTGYTSRRGRIIRKITNKVHVDPQMFKNAIFFFLESLAVGIVIYLATLPILLAANITPQFRIYRFFDFIGFSFPPAFPIYFNVAYSLALYRLRKKDIYGTQPHKTIEAGFLKTICFDKTGTLTQNQLQIQKIYAFNSQQRLCYEGKDLANNLSDPLIQKIYQIFCSCHSIKHIDGVNLGDEIDLKMFEATQSSLQVSVGENIKFRILGKKKLQVLKINQFQSKRQHMSVLVYNPQLKQFFLFVKGAPQKIHRSSTKQFTYFDDLLKKVSLNGLRSIGMAYRKVQEDQAKLFMTNDIPKNILEESDKKQLSMVGLVTFQNKLKADTKSTIDKLSISKIESKMITGDNIYIAIETAYRSGILPHKQSDNKVVLIEGKRQLLTNQIEKQVGQRKFKAKLLIFSNLSTLTSSELVLQKEQEIVLTENDTYFNQPYYIAVDNDFLKIQPSPKLSNSIKIYARITPQNKALIVKRLKEESDEAYEQRSKSQKLTISRPKIGMVGDGANDLLALKQADVGFGISQRDASYGSCFSINQLMNIEHTIRQSKNTCTVILQCIRYFGTISFLKITCAVLMMTESTYFSASQLSYFNFASTLIIPIAITLASPSESTTPLKPLINMLCLKNNLVYWGNIIIPSLSIICGYFYFRMREDFVYNPVPRLTPEGFYTLCQTTTIVFLLVQVPFALNSFFLYNNGHNFKEPFYKNYVLLVIVLLNCAADIFFFLKTESLKGFLGLVPIAKDGSGVLIAITVGFCVFSFLFNWWVSSKNYEQKAFMEEHPGENIQSMTGSNNKIQNQNYPLNDTETFDIEVGTKKNILNETNE